MSVDTSVTADTSIPTDVVKRTLVTIDADEDEKIRVYYTPDGSFMGPSVTTVTDSRVSPDKDDSIDGWKDAFDGQSSYARPWWKDQMVFKQLRGTLAHYAMASVVGDPSGDTYFHEVGDEGYGYEEYLAEYKLRKWSTFAPSASADDQLTPQNNEYDGEHAWDRAMRDVNWCLGAFRDWWNDDWTVLDVEAYVTGVVSVDSDSRSESCSTTDQGSVGDSCSRSEQGSPIDLRSIGDDDVARGYGGQLDLLYEDEDGNVVCCDLKTSSGIRRDYKLQLAGYAYGLDESVDVLQVARFHPDTETTEVETDDDWARTRRGLEHEFLGLVDRAHADVYSDVFDQDPVDVLPIDAHVGGNGD